MNAMSSNSIAAAEAPSTLSFLHISPSYHFNASRWLWTGHALVPAALRNIYYHLIRGEFLVKIVKIFLCALPALVFDLVYMARMRICLQNRAITKQETSTPPSVNANPELTKKENTQTLQKYLSTEELAALTISFLSSKEGMRKFEQTRRFQDLVFLFQGSKDVTCEGWDYIHRFSNPANLYPLIQGFNFSGEYRMTPDQLLSFVKKVPRLKYLNFPGGPKLPFSQSALIEAIRLHRESLEEIDLGWNGADAVTQELVDCPNLTKLSISGWIEINQPNGHSLIQLALKRKLRKFTLWTLRKISVKALEAIVRFCPLEYLSLPSGRYQREYLPQDLFKTILEQSAHQPLDQRLNLRVLDCAFSLSDQDLLALATHCPYLKSINLAVHSDQISYFEELLPRWTHLETLHMDYSYRGWDVNESDIVRIVNKSPSLKHLHFEWRSDFTLQLITQLGMLNRHLKLYISRHFQRDSRSPEEFFKELTQKYPHVKVKLS